MSTVNSNRILIVLLALLGFMFEATAQVPTICPAIFKRSNGNGQENSCPSVGGTPVAANVVGTPFANWLATNGVLSSEKTGDINFRWAGTFTNLPVITRAWLGTTQINVIFGPPPVPTFSNGFTYASYCFYKVNLPNQGAFTIELSDPATGQPFSICTYQLGTNEPGTTPVLACSPTITSQPVSVLQCGNGSASFTVAAFSANGYQWQYNNGGTWTNVSGADFTGASTPTLTVANATSYNGRQFRVIVSSTTCSNTITSNTVSLTATPLPTAVFTGTSSVCGLGARNLQVNLTGDGPWSLTYTSTPSGGSATPTTVNNITSSPYFISVNPAVPTAYQITAVSDQICANNAPSGNTSVSVVAPATVTLTNPTACLGGSSFNLAYSNLTGAPDKYSISTGIRAMAGFTAINNANITASPLSISIPTSGVPVGTYDFNLTLTNSVAGCVSSVIPFTVTVYKLPVVTASADRTNICPASTVNLSAAPAGLSSYSWSSSPGTFTATSATTSATPTVNTTYTVVGTDSRGCQGSASVAVAMLPSPTLSINSSAGSSICKNAATILTASGGNTYSWSPATGLSATNGPSVVAGPTTTTTYTVTSQSATGCAGVGTYTLTVTDPNITISPTSATVCAGGSTLLTASGGTSYSWLPTAGLSATTGASVTATPAATTTYNVIGTNNGCVGTASATVTVAAAPINTATSSRSVIKFCAQGTPAIPLTVNLTSVTGLTSMTWGYATSAAVPYTNVTTATNLGSVTLTPSVNLGTGNAVLTLTGYSNGGYGGPTYFRLVIVTSTCTYNYDIFVSDVKGTTTAIAPIASKSTICTGDNTTLTVGDLTNGATAQWQSSPNNSTWTPISGATNGVYTTPALSASTYYRVVYGGGNGNCGATSASTLITVSGTSLNNTITLPASTCTDGSTAYTITGTTVSGASFQWQRSTDNVDFTNIVGATAQNYTIPGNLVVATTYYRRLAGSSVCNTVASNVVAALAPIGNNQITTAPASYCGSFSSVAITATTPTGGSGTYSYQWQSSTDGVSFNPISGATLASYTTGSNITQTTWYRRVVTTPTSCTSTSPALRLAVNSNPTVTIGATAASVCGGNTTTLTASGASSYVWSSASGTGTLNTTTGSTVIATPIATITYTVTGTDGNGCTAAANQTITYNALPASPTLTSGNITLCNQASYTLSTAVSSTPGGTVVEWYRVNEPNATYLITSATQSGTYYAYAKNTTTGCFSVPVALTLTFANPTTPVPLVSSITGCAPATASLTSIEPLIPSGFVAEWHTVSSNPTGGTLVATPGSVSSGTYYLYSKTGTCYSAASTPVVVTINSQPSVAVTSTSLSACSPASINLSSNITNPNGTNDYNWYNAANPIVVNRVPDPTLVTTGTYYLYAVDGNNCRSNASSAVTATVVTSPSVAVSNPDLLCTGVGTTLSASASNATSYQWELSTNGGASFANASGGVYANETTTTLSISSVNGLDGTLYRLVATGTGGCSTTSNVISLTVDNALVLSSSTPDTTMCSGLDGILSVASNAPAANYQWEVSTDGGNSYLNVVNNSTYYGANSSGLILRSVPTSFNGYKYRCVVTNSCSNATSPVATLTVNATPAAPTTTDLTLCLSAPTSPLTATATGSNSLNWYTVATGGTGNPVAPTPSTASSGITNYYVTQVSTDGCESGRSTLQVTVDNEYVWYGYTNDNWNVGSNWQCSVAPYPGANVRLIPNPPIQPKIPNDVIVGNIVYGANSYVDLNDRSFTINGTITGDATFKSTSGSSLVFADSAVGSYFFVSGHNQIQNLTVSGSRANVVQGADTMIVHGTVAPSAGTLNFNGKNVRLKSFDLYTARVARVSGALLNANNVTVERFVPAKLARRWSSMASPVSALISTSWQQDIHITGPGIGASPCAVFSANTQPGVYTNGFDATQSNPVTMYQYNGGWQAITNSNATNLTPGRGYYVNVRGDRNIYGCQLLQYTNNQASNTPTFDVTVKATGTLTQGDLNVTANALGFHFLGNAYACEIRFDSFYADNNSVIQKKYWLYPATNIDGNYMTWDGENHAGTPAGFTGHNNIASGQSFFVNVTTPGTIVFKERQKTTTLQRGAFKITSLGDKIRINIFKGGDTVKSDDALVVFDRDSLSANTQIGVYDSRSINIGQAWVATKKGTSKLSIHKRYQNYALDTVDVWFNAGTAGNYSFSFTDMLVSGTVYLQDNLLNTVQNLSQNPVYAFSVAAAGENNTRFRLLFDNTTPLSSEDFKVSARLIAGKAHVMWRFNADGERKSYSIQSSDNGREFTEIGTMKSEGADKNTQYDFTDQTPLTAANRYYRVKAIMKDEKSVYSKIVAIRGDGAEELSFSLYPNPVVDELNVIFTGSAKPATIRVYTAAGSLVHSLACNGDDVRIKTTSWAQGAYLLEITATDGTRQTQKFFK